jgi:hypothetical protein
VLNQGETGRQAARYYFAGPLLRYYEAEASRRPPSGSAMQRVRLVLAFDESGRLVEGTHQVDGAVVALDSVMIRGVVARASDVARQWATVPESTPATPAGAGDAVKR